MSDELVETISIVNNIDLLNTDKHSWLVSPVDSPDKVNVILAGHSHCYAMTKSYSEDIEVSKKFESAGIASLHTLVGFDVEYWQSLGWACKDKIVCISWQGNQHNADFMFKYLNGFDFVLSENKISNNTKNKYQKNYISQFSVSYGNSPIVANNISFDSAAKSDESELQSDSFIVAEEVIRTHFDPSLAGLSGIINFLKESGAKKVILLGTPPPRGEASDMRPLFQKEVYFINRAKQLGIDINEIPITPLKVRIKLWRLLQIMLQEYSIKNNIDYISVPEGACNADGSLKRDLWNDDVTHANWKFGALYIKKIIEHIRNLGG